MKEWNALNKAKDAMTYRICYCSVLNECWRNDLYSDLAHPGQLHPTPVKACPLPTVAFIN